MGAGQIIYKIKKGLKGMKKLNKNIFRGAFSRDDTNFYAYDISGILK
ncbi:MAG: hypothetical protein FD145_1567 [Candidatus Saganbacteria bacterium]|uniref:Uncharacterized protein n=1 Tax=Candidatus Saganbacteria bacterium TaxID=2575572 RepID=A0A833KZJ8_UNCSA|nr:MAG: hypothetical protein FD145_1567 [Candidatus Saganbacteria bacterium]